MKLTQQYSQAGLLSVLSDAIRRLALRFRLSRYLSFSCPSLSRWATLISRSFRLSLSFFPFYFVKLRKKTISILLNKLWEETNIAFISIIRCCIPRVNDFHSEFAFRRKKKSSTLCAHHIHFLFLSNTYHRKSN